jgi:dihydrofolate synthase/folylpolyglutamate synthase
MEKTFEKFLETIASRGIRCGLDRVWTALELLDHPQKKYRTIHVAGTNGKGSTCQFIAQILARNGCLVGLTLSPHVDDYRERIQITGLKSKRVELIPLEDLLRTHEKLLAILPQGLELTYFEWSTLLALQYFADQCVDFAVLETGMGGRWDATNTCQSCVSGITTVALDHQTYLGDTVEKILEEKLQIIKPDSDFLFGPSDENLVALARAHCQKKGARFHSFICPEKANNYLQINWAFATQIVGLLSQQGVTTKPDTLVFDAQACPPARLEIISQQPEILVDGAHNEQGIQTLAQHVRQSYPEGYHLIFGCLSDRPFLKLASLIRSSHNNYWLQFDAADRTTAALVYQKIQKELGGEVVSLNESLRRVISRSTKPIVVCGSLYLCAQFKRWYLGTVGSEQWAVGG